MDEKKIIIPLLALIFLSGCAGLPLRKASLERMSEINLYTRLELSRRYRGFWGKENARRNMKRIKEEIIRHNPDWDLGFRQAILDGRIARGMNKKQVLASWGLPTDRSRPLMKNNSTDQWTYGNLLGERTYLFFDSGTLNNWHEESFSYRMK